MQNQIGRESSDRGILMHSRAGGRAVRRLARRGRALPPRRVQATAAARRLRSILDGSAMRPTRRRYEPSDPDV